MQIKRTPFEDSQRGFGGDREKVSVSAEDEAKLEAAENALYEDGDQRENKDGVVETFAGGCGCWG
jgi:hypothetical protein